MIDLHSHSVFSDGAWTPAQLVDEALRVGLTALALTDHDTTEGLPDLMSAAEAGGADGRRLTAVAGVELSVEGPSGAFHLLGYCFDPEHPELRRVLARVQAGREARNREMVARLGGLGCLARWEDIEALAGAGVMGRPHMAEALKRAGDVKTREEAFGRYLKRGAPAYVERYRLDAAEAIGVFRDGGGVSVLAHPGLMGLKGESLDQLLAILCEAGLDGLEAHYPEHSRRQELEFEEAAARFGLVATGGSDFHGVKGGGVRLGSGYGTMAVSDGILERLQARAGGQRVVERV